MTFEVLWTACNHCKLTEMAPKAPSLSMITKLIRHGNRIIAKD